MKSMSTFALVVLLCVPAKAQYGGMGGMGGGMGGGPVTQARSIELELLEMEQEVDKAALKEAFLIQARQGMKPVHGTDREKRQFEEDTVELRHFIAKKKEAITARAAEMRKSRGAGSLPAARNVRVDQQAKSDQQAKADRQATYEKYAEAQIDVQLLEAQLSLLQEPLNAAVQALAAAELAASNDESQRPKAEAARKQFEKIKARYVGFNKRLQAEQQGLQAMGMMSGMMGGMGGMGGGMGGMGGGMR